MSITLYRKYRPQTFQQVVSQNHVKITLENEILSGKVAHAYIFAGPRGVGKTTIARILAKALNCQKREGAEPCDLCPSCTEIREGRSLDLIEIDAASNRGINEIRELREQVRVMPLKEKFKVFIIDEVHMLTPEAFNALLKTLEEPPAHAVFILATTEIHKIPETIISRCQRFDFKKVPVLEIVQHLTEIAKKEKVKVTKEVLESVARHSEGYLRDAVSLLGQILALGEDEIGEKEAAIIIPRSDTATIIQFISCLFKSQAKPAFDIIKCYLDEGGDLEFFARQAIELLRMILLAKLTDNWQELIWELDKETLIRLQSQLNYVKTDFLRQALEHLLEALLELKRAVILELPLELAVVKIIELNNNPVQDNPSKSTDFNQPTGKPSGKVEPLSHKSFKDEKNQPATGAVNFEEIMQKWPEIILALKEYNHSLSTFLKAGRPLRTDGQTLVMGFKYAFHWERVRESKNRQKLEEILEKIFSEKIFVQGEIDEQLEILDSQAQPEAGRPLADNLSGQNKDSVIDMVLDAFSGEVAE